LNREINLLILSTFQSDSIFYEKLLKNNSPPLRPSILKIGTLLALDGCTMNKSRGIFARVLVGIDMLSTLPNQIFVERPEFAFIVDIEYKKFPSFFSSCKMIGHDLSKCKRQLDTNYNTGKMVFPKPLVVQYKHVVA